MENKNITSLAEYEPETLVMGQEPSLKLQWNANFLYIIRGVIPNSTF